MFTFVRYCQTFSKVAYHFAFPPAMISIPDVTHPAKHLVLTVFQNLVTLVVCIESHCCLDLYFPDDMCCATYLSYTVSSFAF
jgi:hypothetical protein